MKIVITTCEGREEGVLSLKSQIPEAIVNFDDFTESGRLKSTAFYNWQRSLKLVGDEATLQLEDDIVLCSNFLARVKLEIAKFPNDVIQFFSLRPKDLIIGSRWEDGGNFLMLQCYYLPAGMAKQIYEYSFQFLETTTYQYSPTDMCIREFLKKNRRMYYIVVPNLVDHIGFKSKINPKRTAKRQSKTFVK